MFAIDGQAKSRECHDFHRAYSRRGVAHNEQAHGGVNIVEDLRLCRRTKPSWVAVHEGRQDVPSADLSSHSGVTFGSQAPRFKPARLCREARGRLRSDGNMRQLQAEPSSRVVVALMFMRRPAAMVVVRLLVRSPESLLARSNSVRVASATLSKTAEVSDRRSNCDRSESENEPCLTVN